ncbi:MAG: thioredoxin family protein [Desulfohalobiaceae bacterium]|nr:thioredoxin family protein [Desulfohalobiaceae bacterium]
MSLHQLTENSFVKVIYDNAEPCLVIFSRKSCHVCQHVVPILEELQSDYQGKFGFYYVDVEEDPTLQQRFSLKGIPQILYFNDGDFRGKQVGKVDDDQIKEKIDSVLEA